MKTTLTHARWGPVLAAVAFLAAGCASTGSSTDYVPPAMGSTWNYQSTSTGSFGSATKQLVQMTVTEATVDGRKLHKLVAGKGATLQTERGMLVAILGPGDRVVLGYDPPLGIEWPLQVGKTATQEITLTAPSGQKAPMTANWKVEAFEDVTVPAGTFKAWRITMVDNFDYKATTWSVPGGIGVVKRLRERGQAHPQGGAGTDLMELVTFSPGK